VGAKPCLPNRRGRDPGRTKNLVLTAGIRLFAEHGYHGVSVDDIVAAAGCNTRMLYHYFGDKEGLYVAVLKEVYARMEKVEMRPLAADASTADIIREMIARHFDFLSHDPEFVNLLMWENLNQGKLLARHPDLLTKGPVISRLRDVLTAAKQRGEIRAVDDVRHLLMLMIGMCFIYFSNRYTLRQAIGLQLDRPAVQAEGLRMIQDMFLAYLGIGDCRETPTISHRPSTVALSAAEA